MAPGRIIEPINVTADYYVASLWYSNTDRQMSSDFTVLKNVSTIALLKQLYLLDIESCALCAVSRV
jgi:hypothetical protein